MPPANLRLTIDTAALGANWRMFAAASGSATCGAAVKADGYGLGAREVAAAFINAGCRELFVAHWDEAVSLGPQPDGVRVAVLHGVLPGEIATALASRAVPVLNTPAQVSAWKAATDRPCDIMVDTGMSRLGLTPVEAVSGLLDGLNIDVLHSHLAFANVAGMPMNRQQLNAFVEVGAVVRARRRALCNSAGVWLGPAYHFDVTRPGIGLYGGGDATNYERRWQSRPVVSLAARVVQVRDVGPGETIGYSATYRPRRAMRIAIVALGYADGFPRGRSSKQHLRDKPDVKWPPSNWLVAPELEHRAGPVLGRVSMDLTAFDVSHIKSIAEGDWLDIDFDIRHARTAGGRSPYELLTGLGHRYARVYQ